MSNPDMQECAIAATQLFEAIRTHTQGETTDLPDKTCFSVVGCDVTATYSGNSSEFTATLHGSDLQIEFGINAKGENFFKMPHGSLGCIQEELSRMP